MNAEQFTQIQETAKDAHGVAWDGCHKIYLAMDNEEAQFFAENYPYYIEDSPTEMAEQVAEWYGESCGLRFVSAVRHDEVDPNAGFTHIIPQFA